MRRQPLPKVATDAMLNAGAAVTASLVLLATVPLYIRHIGLERYGALAVIWVLLGYFGFFDLGLSRAAANFGAKAQRGRALDSIFSTTCALNLALGCVGGLGLWAALGVFFGHYLHASPTVLTELQQARPWIAAFLPLACVNGVFTGLLEARGRFAISNALQVFGSVAFQILPLIAALRVGPGLDVVAPAALLSRAVVIAASAVATVRFAPITALRLPDLALARRMFGFGGWVLVTSLVSPLLTALDQLLISSVAGVKALPHYAAPNAIAQRFTIIPFALFRSLYPRFARAESAESQRLVAGTSLALAMIMTLAVSICILGARPGLTLWIDRDFAQKATAILVVQLLAVWANSLAFVPFAYLEASGRPRVPAKLHLAELGPYMVALYFGLQTWGLIGAAWAGAARVTVDAVLLFAFAGARPRLLLSLSPGLAIVLAAAAVAQRVTDLSALALAAAVAAAATGVWAWLRLGSGWAHPPAVSTAVSK